MKTRLKLGVNIDHVAALRQARGTPYPDLVAAAHDCVAGGADGITVHLREDRRHIQDADVWRLRRDNRLPLNLEMANVPEIVRFALRVRPAEVCLVPERRAERTTERGVDAAGRRRQLQPTIRRLRAAGIVVSLFVDPDPRQLAAAAELGAPVVELHTGDLAGATSAAARRRRLAELIRGAELAHALGLRVNAGHGINTDNLRDILRIPWLDTLNIGHSIIARALFCGLTAAVRELRRALAAYRGGA